MFSRRRFLQTSSLAAGATAAFPALARAAACDQSLPPAIAALRSRRKEAQPITIDERSERQERARQLMRDNHLDAILLAPSTSLAYFTGIRWEGGERLFAMVLPAKGDAFYVAPAFEEGRAREQIASLPTERIPTSVSGKKTKAPTPASPKDSPIAEFPLPPSVSKRPSNSSSPTICEKPRPAPHSPAPLRSRPDAACSRAATKSCPPSHHQRRLRSRLQILHSPARPRHWHGRTRVALSRSRRRHQASS